MRLAVPAIGAAAALVLGAAVAVPSDAAPAAAPRWVATSTHALHLRKATKLGPAATGRGLRITVGLTPRHRAALDRLIAAQAKPSSSRYQHYLTPAQFRSRYAASPAAARRVAGYLRGAGLTSVQVSSNRLLVTADATVGQAEKAFHTTIARFRQFGSSVLANTSAAEVPTALSGDVTAVLGLSTLGMDAGPSLGLPKLTGYYPKEFDTVYHSGKTKAGKGTTLAVIAEGDISSTLKDLRTAEAKQNLRKVPVKVVYSGVKSTDTSGADEWDLDTQSSTGVAPAAKKLYMYVSTSLTDSDLARALSDFAAQDVANSGSASLGECDLLPYLDGAMQVDDMIFAEAAAQGQTFFASTGDTGSSCAVLPTNGVPGSGPVDTEYPASSPYVVGVGGTTLLTDDNDAYESEIAWNSGGGGVSPVETAPSWQDGVNLASAAGLRGVPDIALDADPDTGALIYVDGSAEQIGGTSLSSPLAMGLWTRLQSTHGNKLGFAAPRLYDYYTATQDGNITTAVPGFHDVELGVNGIYSALPGYDYTTGLGSFDVAALSKALG